MKRMKVSKDAYIEKNDTDLLKRMSFRYLPYWPLFLAAVIVSFAVGLVYLEYTAPIYGVTASILVKDEKKGLDDSKAEDALNFFGEKKIVENEIEVIHSRSMVSQMVTHLYLYAPIEEKSGFIYRTVHLPVSVYRSAYLTSPVQIELEKPEELHYEVNRVKFRYDAHTQTVITSNATYPLNKWTASPCGRIRFSKNPLATTSVPSKTFFFSLVSLPKATNEIQNNLEVSPTSKLSTVINISYKDAVPARGEAIINELINCYTQASINDKAAAAANTLDFVEKRLKLSGKQLDDVEADVQSFRTANGIVNVSQQSNQYLQNVSANDQKISEMDIQLSVLSQIESYVLSKQSQPGLVPSTLGIKDPMLTQLLDKLYEAEIQYEKLKKTTAEENPILLSVKNEIAKIKPNVLENVRNQRNSILAAKSRLEATSLHYNDLLNTLPDREKELTKISRQQNIENSIYSFLLQKKEEASLAFNAAVAGSKIIDKAQSSAQPVSPRAWLICLIALVLPIVFVSFSIDAREFFSNKVLFRRTIEELTVLPIIGELGYKRSKEMLVVRKHSRTAITEQFRSLRSSVASSLLKEKGKVIMVTSSMAIEGKSFVAINLAVVFAQAGKRTVLIEADMYKPKLSAALHLNDETGLSDVLETDQPSSILESCIYRTATYNNLFIIPAGNAPSNPSELLMNSNFDILMKELENQFDIIIIDSVPINPVPDAYTICKFATLTLFVVRHGITPKEKLLIIDEDPKMQDLKNVHIVFNGIRRRGIATSGFGHSYGYGHNGKEGYGYYGHQRAKTVLS